MSAHTSASQALDEPPFDASMSTSKRPSEPLSATAAAAAGTLDSSAFHKERRASVSVKRHHDDDVDYEKEDSSGGAHNDIDDDDDSNRTLRETRTTSTTVAAAADSGDAVMASSPATKKKRISVQLPEQIRAQKAAAAAAAAAGTNTPPKPERTSSTSTASPPTTPHTPHTPSHPSHAARRLSMTEDQKRASFALTLAKALQASYPLSPVSSPTPGAVSPHIQSIAASLEQSLYSRHAGLTLDYTAHVRDIAFNLTHSSALSRRIVDGRVSIERVSGMNWKEFADGEVRREREERKEEDLVAHLAPVDVTPGILPNAKTVDK